MVIKAVPTEFRGTKYRSRLEAEWARWLHERKVNYQYESRRFKLELGIWYLPDFYLPEARTYIEVKGGMERLHKPYQLAQQLKRECSGKWPEEGTMLLLAGPVGTFYNTEATYFKGFTLIHCPNCTFNSIVTNYEPQKCRFCGSTKVETRDDVPAATKPLKWLLLERDPQC